MAKLSKFQRELIAAVQLRADAPASAIAKQLGVQERSVQHQLHRLSELGVIRKAPFLDIYPLGLRYMNIYFSVGSAQERNVQAFISYLMRSPKVSWIGALGGDFHYGIALAVRDMDETKTFFEGLPERFQALFFEKHYIYHLTLRVFPYKYLSSKKVSFPSIGYGSKAGVEIDDLDTQILALMAESHETSGRAVARTLGKPHATVETRIRRLEKSGVISGYWYMVDPAQLGYQTHKLLVYAKGVSGSFSSRLLEFSKQHPNIVYFIEGLGSWDFELGLDVEHSQNAVAVTQQLLDSFGGSINTVKVVPLFNVFKWRQYPAAGKQ